MVSSEYRLTVGRDEKGRLLAIITTGGHPQINTDIDTHVVSVEIVKNMKEAKGWYREQKLTRPWETRQ